MSAVAAALSEPLSRNTTRGVARLSVTDDDGRPAVSELYSAQPLRLFIPRPGVGETLTAVIGNLSGGIVGGDDYQTEVNLGRHTKLTLAAQAAEKVYRSTGSEAENRFSFDVGENAAFEWLPQGTIVFDRALFRQQVRFDVSSSATMLAGAISVLGRSAMGETLTCGRYREHWDYRRDGKLVWADRFDLGDAAGAAGPASAMRGVTCFATALFSRRNAADDLDWAREILSDGGSAVRSGVTAVDDHLLAMRWLGADAMRLRDAVGAFWGEARARWLGLPVQLPVIWRI
ncbi:urease accessory protein UreD [Nisaea acidiphila]|uniref:Urease accessory protein UreD n=1 Tax=Nisaea acidiphila TaxID=1862145 RepID=A0A9J7ATL2_9PROT|nr:urease accessory protein UreD [Nisaea acidiphila]UUX50680.1 urease accessory protein UreD [Nisaea acidiphila]